MLMMSKNVSGCDCDFDGHVGRVEFFNELDMPSPVYADMRDYFYGSLTRKSGQYELIYITSPECAGNNNTCSPFDGAIFKAYLDFTSTFWLLILTKHHYYNISDP